MLCDRRVSVFAALIVVAVTAPAVAAASEPESSTVETAPAPEVDAKGESLYPPCAGLDPERTPTERRAAADEEILDAEQAFANGDHELALRHIEFAQCHHPDPDYDFMRAAIHVAAGDCAAARASAKAYFSAEPNDTDAAALRTRMQACAPDVEAVVRPTPVPAALPPAELVPGPVANDRVRPWHLDPAGGALLGVGLVATATGTGLLIGSALTDRTPAESFSEFAHRRQRSRNLRIAGGVVLGVGLGMTVGAIVRYALLARRERKGTRRSNSVAELLSPVVRF